MMTWSFTPLPSNRPEIYGTQLHQISVTYRRMHIYLGHMYSHPLFQLTIDLWNTTTPNMWVMMTWSFTPSNQPKINGTPLHQMSFAYSRMHIYLGQMYPLLQSTIDLWNTTTLNKFNISKNAHIPRADIPIPPPPIDHRSMEHHYIESLGDDDIKF